ncbi:8274_t:CDS:1 [Acaulospora morrowiae]|uniref:8274_t:CDS:1 n=1 Tax=Acaulospora morrowiae TaxID=94023 RepID=A0A9N9IB98_9GLOM|nr:8274_t:CDS:1 [Acaulospora morrowiae]
MDGSYDSQESAQESKGSDSDRSNLNSLPDNFTGSITDKSDQISNAGQLNSENVLEDTVKSELEHSVSRPNVEASNKLNLIDSQQETPQPKDNEVTDINLTTAQQVMSHVFTETRNATEEHYSDESEQFEDDEHLGSSENRYEQDQLFFVQHPDDGEDSDYMVKSINTNSGSENSLNMGDDSGVTIITAEDIYTPPSPSQNSEVSMESLPTGDVSDSYVLANISPTNSFHEGIEAEGSTLYSSGDSQSQILAPLSISHDGYEDDEGRTYLTPILSRSDAMDVPMSPTISSIYAHSEHSERIPSLLNSNIVSIPDIFLRHPQINNSRGDIDFQQDFSILTIIHQQMLIPFIHGFSWAFGIHLYRYFRHGFSLRELWRSSFAGITGRSNNIQNRK